MRYKIKREYDDWGIKQDCKYVLYKKSFLCWKKIYSTYKKEHLYKYLECLLESPLLEGTIEQLLENFHIVTNAD